MKFCREVLELGALLTSDLEVMGTALGKLGTQLGIKQAKEPLNASEWSLNVVGQRSQIRLELRIEFLEVCGLLLELTVEFLVFALRGVLYTAALGHVSQDASEGEKSAFRREHREDGCGISRGREWIRNAPQGHVIDTLLSGPDVFQLRT